MQLQAPPACRLWTEPAPSLRSTREATILDRLVSPPIALFEPEARNLQASQPESQECAPRKAFFFERQRGRTAFGQGGLRGEMIWATTFLRDLAGLLAGKPWISALLITIQ
jgi:hypothetical protein